MNSLLQESIDRLKADWERQKYLHNKPTHTVQVHDEEDFDKTKVVNF